MRMTTPSPRRTRRVAVLATVLLLGGAAVAAAHDMFVKPERFRVAANADVLVRLLNGTFSRSENSITRDRLLDISVVSPSGRERVDTAAWTTEGDTSTFRLRTGSAGTYVLGVSTRPRVLEMKAKEFNLYLAEDGIPDVLAARRRGGELGKKARERYSKHVKALLQAGATPSDDFATVLGYPAEIVPQENPYALRPGATLHVRTLVDGRPAANQYVQYGGRTTAGGRIAQRSVRTNAEGVAAIPLGRRGTWYVKFISMARLDGDAEADYESRWATLTFEVQ
jgi:uncharacterized GH25 family protein